MLHTPLGVQQKKPSSTYTPIRRSVSIPLFEERSKHFSAGVFHNHPLSKFYEDLIRRSLSAPLSRYIRLRSRVIPYRPARQQQGADFYHITHRIIPCSTLSRCQGCRARSKEVAWPHYHSILKGFSRHVVNITSIVSEKVPRVGLMVFCPPHCCFGVLAALRWSAVCLGGDRKQLWATCYFHGARRREKHTAETQQWQMRSKRLGPSKWLVGIRRQLLLGGQARVFRDSSLITRSTGLGIWARRIRPGFDHRKAIFKAVSRAESVDP